MKKTLKKAISLLLSVVICFASLSFSIFALKSEASYYKAGDIIQFGSYPQSQVTDTNLLSELNNLDFSLISYDYYVSNSQSDFMKYSDVIHKGEKYRVVYFEQYRPYWNSNPSSYTEQENNGYYTKTYYWFKYEPLNWQILSTSGLIISTSIIDSTFFNVTNSFSSWESSYMRKWLNSTFYNTAFSDDEKIHFKDSVVHSNAFGTATKTIDKVYLLSYDEALSNEYGFNSSSSALDTNKAKKGTDYALCQGLWQNNNYGDWWLRTPKSSTSLYIVNYDGTLKEYGNLTAANITSLGIVPVVSVNLSSILHKHNYSSTTTPPTCTTQGYTTYTCACGDSYISDYVGVSEHNYFSTVSRPATHLTEGIRTFTCTSCGDSYTENTAKTTTHSYFVSNLVSPTCEKEGYTIYSCECGQSYKDDLIPANGHNYKGNTCQSCGESKSLNCSCNCHKTGFLKFIWKILNFFYKLFKTNKTCACGIAHY